jgi:hypothetical protein
METAGEMIIVLALAEIARAPKYSYYIWDAPKKNIFDELA